MAAEAPLCAVGEHEWDEDMCCVKCGRFVTGAAMEHMRLEVQGG